MCLKSDSLVQAVKHVRKTIFILAGAWLCFLPQAVTGGVDPDQAQRPVTAVFVPLRTLYEHPEDYVGKNIQVEGYLSLNDSPFKHVAIKPWTLGSIRTGNNHSVTDGTVELRVQGSASLGRVQWGDKGKMNYVRLDGDFGKSPKSMAPLFHETHGKPEYVFRLSKIEGFLKK
jgi:hypothetical protein